MPVSGSVSGNIRCSPAFLLKARVAAVLWICLFPKTRMLRWMCGVSSASASYINCLQSFATVIIYACPLLRSKHLHDNLMSAAVWKKRKWKGMSAFGCALSLNTIAKPFKSKAPSARAVSHAPFPQPVRTRSRKQAQDMRCLSYRKGSREI